jgi:hypothetical protein
MTPGQWWMLWSGLVAAAIGALMLAIGLRGDAARGRKRCPKCWYDLAGLARAMPVVCPECGRVVKTERALKRRRRFRRVVVVGVVFVLTGVGAVGWPLGVSGEWVAWTPTWVLTGLVRAAGPEPAAGTSFPPRRTSTRWTRAVQAYWTAESLAKNPHRAWWSGVYGAEARVAVRRLESMLRSESAAARERAVHALGYVPISDLHVDKLGRMLVEDPSADVRFACFEVLHGSGMPRDRAQAQMLAAALAERDRDLRSYYALRLSMLPGGEQHADVLVEPLRAARDGPGVWESAEKAIGDYESRVIARERLR